MKTLKKQGGFTLVEIAIVLVIVGLLLAGVLKGQELIENSRIKSMAKDMDSMTAVVRSYQDRYRGVPGDETPAPAAARGWIGGTAWAAGNGNSLIGAGGGTDPFTVVAASEEVQAIRALRYSGFIEGNPLLNALPVNSGGGVTVLTNNVLGLAGNTVCLNGLTGKQAAALDRLLDDGVGNTGTVRAMIVVAPAVVPAAVPTVAQAAAAVVEAGAAAALNVVVCRTL